MGLELSLKRRLLGIRGIWLLVISLVFIVDDLRVV